MTAVIVCGGKIENYAYMKKYLEEAKFIISADSGARHCKNFNIMPDLLVGDFDSVTKADYTDFVAAGVEILTFPPEKDMTDSELAIEIAMERGCSRIIMLGALGTRLDHSMSNIFLLKKLLDKGIDGTVADEYNEIKLINCRIELERKRKCECECESELECELEHENGDFVTLLPLVGSVKGVTTQGLYYPLTNATLDVGSSLGVSNRFSEDKAHITVKEGYLLVIQARD